MFARKTGRAARHAVTDDAVLDEFDFLEPEDDRPSLSAVAKQLASALVVSVLGLAVVGTVSIVAAPYSTAVNTSATSSTVGGSDITRAEPKGSPAAAAIAALVATGDAAAGGTMPDSARNSDISRNAMRSELTKAVTDQLADQRAEALTQASEQVATTAIAAASDVRAGALAGQAGRIAAEVTRQQDEKAAAEAAAAAAKLAAKAAAASKVTGTLVRSASSQNAGNPALEAALATVASTSGFVSPILPGSYTLGARWGQYGVWARYHTGQDFPAAYGTPIRAVASGVVMPSTGGSWAGTHVVIMHSGGGQTLYAHMSGKTVSPGTVVKAGQLIGYVGLTGRTFGTHLHFEYYSPGARVGDVYSTSDPYSWLLRNGVRL